MSSFTDTIEREKQVDFVNYYTRRHPVGVGRQGKDVDPDNACGLKVAVQATTYEDTDEVPAKSEACVAAGKAAIEKVQYDSQDDATNAVVARPGRRHERRLARHRCTRSRRPTARCRPPASRSTSRRTASPSARARRSPRPIQAAMQSLIDDGTYSEILDKWGVADGGIDRVHDQRARRTS